MCVENYLWSAEKLCCFDRNYTAYVVSFHILKLVAEMFIKIHKNSNHIAKICGL